jgi:hypothetical protein
MYTKTNKVLAGHVGRTYEYGGDIQIAIETLDLTDLNMPDDPPDHATRTIEKFWEKEVDEIIKRRSALQENIKTLYSLVWGQYTENMPSRVEATADYPAISNTLDGL